MDTTLRFKAIEKESLTSKFLFNRCYIFFILVQYMLVSAVQCMKRFRSLPLITLKFHDTFEDLSGKGCGSRGRITIEQVSSKVLPALSFMDICLNSSYVNQIDGMQTADIYYYIPTKLNAIMQS